MSMVCNASYSFNLFNLDVRECGQMSYKLCQGEKKHPEFWKSDS